MKSEIIVLCIFKRLHSMNVIRNFTSYEIARYTPFSQSTVYRSLRKLEEKGMLKSMIVSHRPNAKKRLYRLTEQGKREAKFFDITFKKWQKDYINDKLAD